MPNLTYRRASERGFRVSADDVEIGSISKRYQHVQQYEYWRWGIDTMPLMDHGGRPPSGEAATFDAALVAFKSAFIARHAAVPTDLWMRNVDHIEACAGAGGVDAFD